MGAPVDKRLAARLGVGLPRHGRDLVAAAAAAVAAGAAAAARRRAAAAAAAAGPRAGLARLGGRRRLGRPRPVGRRRRRRARPVGRRLARGGGGGPRRPRQPRARPDGPHVAADALHHEPWRAGAHAERGGQRVERARGWPAAPPWGASTQRRPRGSAGRRGRFARP
jgi:hypothetical protein